MMNVKSDFSAHQDRIVYVKPVNVADLPISVQEEAGDASKLFAVHDADGAQLALVADRHLAFALARQNDMLPVTVH